ncbi:MAG: phosphoribosyl-ATP diphosphatase [Pseudomonadota bacterium]
MSTEDVLQVLGDELEDRKGADASDSYVASLYAKGRTHILKKLGEEATETVIAGAAGTDRELVAETADLWFHSLVLLAHRGLGPADVLAELERRRGVSGLEEKRQRTP